MTAARRPDTPLLFSRRVLTAVLTALFLVTFAPAGAAQPADDEDEEVDAAATEPAEDEDEDDVVPEGRRGARAGRPETAPPAIAPLEVVLRVTLDAPASAQAAVLGRRAFVPLRNGRITSVDIDTGRVGWSAAVSAEHALAAGNGLVFAATADALTALDTSGATRWSLPVPGGFSAPPLWDTGWLIAPTRSGDVLCLRASDGQVLWTRHLESPVSARPAIAGDRVYVTLEDGRILALDLRTGAVEWERRLGGRGASPLALDDRLFVGAADKFFYCLSTEDGDRRWRWRAGGAVVSAPVVDTRHVYFTGLNNVLRALDRFNGSQKWMTGLPLRPIGGPLLLGDLVLVSGVGAETRAYRVTDGRLAAEHTATMDLSAAPQLLPHPLPEFSSVLLLGRDGGLQLLRRRLDVPIVPLTEPIGVPVPLGAPPGIGG